MCTVDQHAHRPCEWPTKLVLWDIWHTCPHYSYALEHRGGSQWWLLWKQFPFLISFSIHLLTLDASSPSFIISSPLHIETDTYFKDLLRYPLAREGVYAPGGPACLAHAMQKITFIQLCCGPNGPGANIFIEIWIKKSGAMVFIFNLDKVLLKKLFPAMNI